MSIAKRRSDDITVQRYLSSDGLHIAWKDSSTGEVYGGIFHGDAADAALQADGLNPAEFWPEVGQP